MGRHSIRGATTNRIPPTPSVSPSLLWGTLGTPKSLRTLWYSEMSGLASTPRKSGILGLIYHPLLSFLVRTVGSMVSRWRWVSSIKRPTRVLKPQPDARRVCRSGLVLSLEYPCSFYPDCGPPSRRLLHDDPGPASDGISLYVNYSIYIALLFFSTLTCWWGQVCSFVNTCCRPLLDSRNKERRTNLPRPFYEKSICGRQVESWLRKESWLGK